MERKKPFPMSQGRSPNLCSVGTPPATCHGRDDGTWKHEMINGLAMAKEEVDCRLRISYRNRVARIAGAWHIASHRGCVRACVRGWAAGRAIQFLVLL